MPIEQLVQSLRSRLRGQLMQPGDDGYEAARRTYNGMIDRRPRWIAHCVDVADVMAGVAFARDADVPLAIRGGNHSAPGLGVCDNGIVLDLSGMHGVHVDPVARTARVAGGCVWGDVDHATHAFGLATPSGIISTTGVGGLTLGGGSGYLSRTYGLTIDNLLAADVVLADGSFVTASHDENPDLFWALRGGGGNFGVVTSFLFRLHPVDTVYGGPMLWPFEQTAQILAWYREFLPNAPEELNGFFLLMNVPPVPVFPQEWHGRTVCGVVWCDVGPLPEAEARINQVRRQFPPAIEHVGPIPFPALQALFDPLLPPGLHWYWKADFFRELSDEAIQLHVRHGGRIPTMLSTMHLYPVDGAVHRVNSRDMAFSFRDAKWSEVIVGIDSDPGNDSAIRKWARDYYEDLHPHSAGGAYINFLMEEGQERIRATYRENYDRLARIKQRYDPGNLFCLNQNILPAA